MSFGGCNDPVWRLVITSVVGSVLVRVVAFVLEVAPHWETCRGVTPPMRRAVDLKSSSWMLEPVPLVVVLWSDQPLAVFPLLLFAPRLLPQSWGLLTPVCWLLLLFQLGCDRIHRLPNLVLAASGRR